ncbi:hypothetical protein [Legionella waltersii]|uniref:MSHA biogenesis protein MshK n=1 Tax=Legionella waltersii TaxID=66969 RepID=A0A0W1AMP7_9GAMM|nr:hypothetical protein [Legionella waltersii]KTD82582.1 hypothetical protein Lwal_0511 [Legionella waltersii]SNV02522.1 Uncharacterised protein [Legionella waltersii]
MKLFKYLIIKVFFLIFFLVNASYAELHDPTKPPVFSETQESNANNEFQLQSIFIGPMRYLAMINGQMVGVGSSIGGARLLAIGKNHVVLLQSGQKKIIYLFGRRLWTAR